MFNKKTFLLATGYILGGLVSSLFNKKKSSTLKKELSESKEQGEGEFKILLENFIETHTNMIDKLKKNILTDENKEIFNEKKEELLSVVDNYKEKGSELVEELKVKGKVFLSEASENLEKLYEEKKDEIDEISKAVPVKVKEKAKKIKENILEEVEVIKEKVKK